MSSVRTFIHPEKRRNEVFFTNSTEELFEFIKYKSKRKGEIAYDGLGNKLNTVNWFPIFLDKLEVVNSGGISKLRRDFRENARKKA